MCLLIDAVRRLRIPQATNDRGDVASFGGYRGPLFESLQQQWGSLYRFESVGGQHGCGSHEGHSGWTCEMLADIIGESATVYVVPSVTRLPAHNGIWITHVVYVGLMSPKSH